uniref:Uncharacterized protein n=1 Tax=Chenopodium quinoa TaxID=63459 RepID=A0A803M0T8_CHEQI
MEKLGIFTLSSQVFNGNQKVDRRKNPPQKKKRYPPLYPRVRDCSYDYARRSSRLKDMETKRSLKEMGISIPEEWTTEVYTEEDEKLLGDCETIWTLDADSLGEDGDLVIESGFNSVAHYLILTRRAGATPKELNDGAEVVDLTAEEIAAAPHDEGSDYSAEWSGAESDDSDSEDETKGDKNNEEQPEKNDEEQLDENQVASAVKSIEAAESEDETEGEKNKEEQPDKNDEEQLDENQVASAEKSIEAAVATDRDEVL